MKKEELEHYICHEKLDILQAMEIINENAKGIVYVVNDDKQLVGSLTDGDFRRWVLSGGDLGAIVSQIMNPLPKYVSQKDVRNAKKVMDDASVESIAVVMDDFSIVDIVFADSRNDLKSCNCNALKEIPIIIMAGGKGTRLYPFTKVLPKPLIPIGDVPILDRIINNFQVYGARTFYLSVGYKKEVIKAYLSEMDRDYKICFLEEDKPLGTAGGIGLIKEIFNTPIVITNCDILISADYARIIDYHEKQMNELTIVAAQKNDIIQYGVIRTEDDERVAYIDEKPSISYRISTGMYIMNPSVIKMIPKDTMFDMTELIQMLIDQGKRVGQYVVSEDEFMDMGQLEQMKDMEKRLSKY